MTLNTLTIILPVYRDLNGTQRAIRSVLSSSNQTPWHLLVMNDASPEAEMPALLERLCANDPRVTLLTNEENLGFVGTVNRGLAHHLALEGSGDVILLNSDTIVHEDWIDRIAAHATERTASITPFSNNATICSTPRIGDCNPDLTNPQQDTAALDALHAAVNRGQSVPIPVGVGFCMWMSRSAIERIGLLDAEAFGRGYGEECDWCLRASAAGFEHRLACDVFVYHEGGSSFGSDAAALKENAERIIAQRYPHYRASVSAWVKADSAKPFRLAVAAQRMRQSGLPVILHISHHLGGGTEKYLRDLTTHFAADAHHLILSPASAGGVQLSSANPNDGIDFTSSLYDCDIALQDAMLAFGIGRIHVQHLVGFNEPQLRRLVQALGVPFDVTLHDYYLLSPLTYLCHPNGQPCLALDEDSCPLCSDADNTSRLDWAAQHRWWLEAAGRVIAPCRDVALRAQRACPSAAIIIMPHLDGAAPAEHITVPELAPDIPLRIAIIGALAWHKGAARLRDLAKAAAKVGLALELHHYGKVLEATPPRTLGSVQFIAHGAYDGDAALQEQLSALQPHLIWFCGTCFETYSYTLSLAMQHGAPLWVPQLGAFAERTANYPATFYYSASASGAALVAQLAQHRIQLAETATAPLLTSPPTLPECSIESGRYAKHYLAPLLKPPHPPIAAPSAGRLRVGWISATPHQPDACAIIRIVQPLTHPALADAIELIPLALHQVWHRPLDVLLVSRTSISASAMIARLMQHAHERGIPVLYDLDDDLLNLPPSHPEYEHYQRLKAGVEQWLRCADRVTVSTQTLHNETACYRSAQQTPPLIVPNYLDERLWAFPASERLAQLHEESAALKIVYVGTPTHQPDLAEILPALRPVLQRHNASLTIIGVHSAADAPRGCTAIEPPHSARVSYTAFAQWLQTQQEEHGWQIGLAPLRDLPFNLGKSGIKYMEYSALGMAGIYADLPPYRDVVTHEQTGLLAKAGQPRAWADALETLLTDSTLRLRLATKAASAVAAHHTIAADAALLRTVILSALSAKPSASNAQPIPSYRQFAAALTAPKRSGLIKRLLRTGYHRYAAHPLMRRAWSCLPDSLKQHIKQRLRRLKP